MIMLVSILYPPLPTPAGVEEYAGFHHREHGRPVGSQCGGRGSAAGSGRDDDFTGLPARGETTSENSIISSLSVHPFVYIYI